MRPPTNLNILKWNKRRQSISRFNISNTRLPQSENEGKKFRFLVNICFLAICCIELKDNQSFPVNFQENNKKEDLERTAKLIQNKDNLAMWSKVSLK